MLGDISVNIVGYKERIEEYLDRRTKELHKLIDYIESVEGSLIRQILYLRHVEGIIWESIGEELHYSKAGVFLKYKIFLKV